MINCIAITGLGVSIGVLSGLFGVGGGFFLVPMLNAVFGVPYNIAVGSGLAQMVGTSAAASLKHRSYGHIDYKLVLFTLVGSLGGAELGARVLVRLRELGSITLHSHLVGKMYLWITFIYIVLLLVVGLSMFLESRKARKRPARGGIVATRISRKIQKMELGPLISLPASRIPSISVWSIIVIGFLIGILSGLLGVGGGFVITPAFIYLFGVPTSVAVGTGLFQIIFTSGYGTLTHFFKGNVDFTLVVCILAGSLIGSQFGAMLNKRLRGAYVRYYFSWVVFMAIGIIILKFLYILGYFDWLR
jgi:uncharacterized membrane protein YfcA